MTRLLYGSAWTGVGSALPVAIPVPPPDPGDPPTDPEGPGDPPVDPPVTGLVSRLLPRCHALWHHGEMSGVAIPDLKGSFPGSITTGQTIRLQPPLVIGDDYNSTLYVNGYSTVPGDLAQARPLGGGVIIVFQFQPSARWMSLINRFGDSWANPGGFALAIAYTGGAYKLRGQLHDGTSTIVLEAATALVPGSSYAADLIWGPDGLGLYVGNASAAAKVGSNATMVGSQGAYPIVIGADRAGASLFAGAIDLVALYDGQPSEASVLLDLAEVKGTGAVWANDAAITLQASTTGSVDPRPTALVDSASPTAVVTVQPSNATATAQAGGTISVEAGTTGGASTNGRFTLDGSPPAVLSVTVIDPDVPPSSDLFDNPFSKLSVHHRPIGAGALPGIPAGYNNSETLVTAAVPGSRGRLDIVGSYELNTGPKFFKLSIKNEASDTPRTITWNGTEGGSNLPVRLKLPAGAGLELYQSPAKDSNPGIFDKANSSDKGPGLYHLFFGYADDVRTAGLVHLYPLDGLDYPGSDSYSRGSSASSLRWPSTILKAAEINPTNPAPIHHPFNVACTRNQSGVEAALHVLSTRRCWPAKSVDGNQTDNGNKGDIPYGARGYLTSTDYSWLLSNYSWSARQRVILDVHRYYGVFFLDGSGTVRVIGGVRKAVLQLRTEPGILTTVNAEINTALSRILPRLSLMVNPRPYTIETELTGGLPYAGGGGPIDVNSVNSAFDA